nr:reverse transcriptase domain-containing protein [Staphylococcus pseudintermedius]
MSCLLTKVTRSRRRKIGAPQGALSPYCNIYLHELDKELEKRGHRFVRYADDFVIFVHQNVQANV